jgi:hypothetical protein
MKASISLQQTFTDKFLELNPQIIINDLFDYKEPNSYNPNTQKVGGLILVDGYATHNIIDLTPEEILQANAINVPTTISRMKFIIQVFLTTGIMYEDIVLFVQNLAFDEAQKYVILTRLRSATHFDRNSSDLLTISAMMGITSEQLDEIFINGNLIE